MPLSRLHTWIAGEVLTASDLNAEFNNIINNLSFALSSQFADGTLANPSIAFVNDADSGWYRPGANQIGWVVGGVEVLRASPYTSGVNFLLVAPGQAGTGAVLVATGSDTSVPMLLIPKGTGYVRVPRGQSIGERFYPGLAFGPADDGLLSITTGTVDMMAGGRRVLRASAYDNATNYLVAVPAQAGQPPVITVDGADTNVALTLRGKGTGYVQANSLVLENFAATQSATITGRAYWHTAERGVHISSGTLIGRIPVLTELQAGDLIIAANASGGNSGATTYARVQRPPVEHCRLVRESNTKLNLASGYIPLKVGGVWVRRDVHTPVELIAPTVDSNTLNYIYAYDVEGETALEAVTTTHVSATQHGVRVKSGDESRTLVGAVFAGTAGAFSDSPAARMTASWFNRPGKTLRVTTASAYQTSLITYVEPDATLRGQFITWGEEVDATLGGGDIRNDTANGFIFMAIGAGSGTTLNQPCDGAGGGQSTGAGSRFFYIAKASTTYSEGTGYLTPLFRVNTGNGVWVASAAPERAVLSAKLDI